MLLYFVMFTYGGIPGVFSRQVIVGGETSFADIPKILAVEVESSNRPEHVAKVKIVQCDLIGEQN